MKHLALHKTGAASAGQAPAAALAFPWPGEEQGGTRVEPAPMGHRGHHVPWLSGQWRQEAARGGGTGTECQARDGDWGRRRVGRHHHAGVSFWGGLTQAAHAAASTWSRNNALPTRPRLRSSIRPSWPRMTLSPDAVGEHSRVRGLWGPWALPSTRQIRGNGNHRSSHHRGTPVSGLPWGSCHSPHPPSTPQR